MIRGNPWFIYSYLLFVILCQQETLIPLPLEPYQLLCEVFFLLEVPHTQLLLLLGCFPDNVLLLCLQRQLYALLQMKNEPTYSLHSLHTTGKKLCYNCNEG